MKEAIISYRCDLGDMMRTMLAAGDKGRSDQPDPCERILEIINDEFPILAMAFSQQCSGHESTKKFMSVTEKFCNALATALYCCRHVTAAAWNTLVDSYETRMKLILSEHFEVQIERWEHISQRGAKVRLTFKQVRPLLYTPLVAAGNGKQQEESLSRNLMCTAAQEVEPLLDWNLYRKLVVTKIRVGGPGALPNFSKVPTEYSTLKRLGLVRGTQISIPDPQYFVSITLSTLYPDRQVKLVPRADKPNPAYYSKPSPSQGAVAFRANMETQKNRIRYFQYVISQINPNARNVTQQQMARMLGAQTRVHANSCIDTKALS